MNIVTIESETFFSDDYTLKKQSTEAYIRDPRFECHGWAVRWNDGPPIWVGGAAFHGIEWQDRLKESAVLCHHAQFDGLILSHHYGIKPRFFVDTLSMS